MLPETEGLQMRRRIANLENQVFFLDQHLGVAVPAPLAMEDDAHLVELIRSGKKMDAISYLRDNKNLGLAETKQEVEYKQRELGI